MKVCDAGREVFYAFVSAVFEILAIKPIIVELGVLRGQNAENLYKSLRPEHLYLIDRWSSAMAEEYCSLAPMPDWIDPLEKYEYYYGGSLYKQETFDRIYDDCQARFQGKDNVTMIRASTIDGLSVLVEKLSGKTLDLAYIDANHQYEYVLRDLIKYSEIVNENGFMVLNDCCHSVMGVRQNLGVLEAVGNFLKRSDFVPAAITKSDFSDLILVRRKSQAESVLDLLFKSADISFVEIPDQLLSAARVLNGENRVNISFV